MNSSQDKKGTERVISTVQPDGTKRDMSLGASNMAVIGDRDSIMPFKAVGMKVMPVTEAQEAAQAFDDLVNARYSVIFVTERVAAKIEERIERIALKTLPSVVLIPDNQGVLGLAKERIRRTVSKAIGADIFRGGDQ